MVASVKSDSPESVTGQSCIAELDMPGTALLSVQTSKPARHTSKHNTVRPGKRAKVSSLDGSEESQPVEASLVDEPPAAEEDEARAWWQSNSSDRFAHRIISGRLGSEAELVEMWNKTWLFHFNWTGQRVLEYGIGGAYLGRELFRHYRIKSYVGIDISQKSITAAENTLKPWNSRTQLLLTPQQFASLTPSIIVCQAVIQHFPSLAYFDDFLKNVEASGADHLMLQIRYYKTVTVREHYETKSDVTYHLLSNVIYMKERLPSYQLEWQTSVDPRTRYLFTGWKRNS